MGLMDTVLAALIIFFIGLFIGWLLGLRIRNSYWNKRLDLDKKAEELQRKEEALIKRELVIEQRERKK